MILFETQFREWEHYLGCTMKLNSILFSVNYPSKTKTLGRFPLLDQLCYLWAWEDYKGTIQWEYEYAEGFLKQANSSFLLTWWSCIIPYMMYIGNQTQRQSYPSLAMFQPKIQLSVLHNLVSFRSSESPFSLQITENCQWWVSVTEMKIDLSTSISIQFYSFCKLHWYFFQGAMLSGLLIRAALNWLYTPISYSAFQ